MVQKNRLYAEAVLPPYLFHQSGTDAADAVWICVECQFFVK